MLYYTRGILRKKVKEEKVFMVHRMFQSSDRNHMYTRVYSLYVDLNWSILLPVNDYICHQIRPIRPQIIEVITGVGL